MGVGRYRLALLILLVVVSMTPAVGAVDHVIVNSRDWRDVYSGGLYASLLGVPSNFLVSSRHATVLTYAIPKDLDDIQIFTRIDSPYIIGYQAIMEQNRYEGVTEFIRDETNLWLAEKLQEDIDAYNAELGSSEAMEQVNKFIILDDAYGYNAISVAPFAVQGRYYVLFANDENIDDVVNFLQDIDPEEVIIYGQVARDVKADLEQFNPETINVGNRFENNIEIVKRYMGINPRGQVILTNGEFLEQSLMDGADPVLFLGRENVPEEVREYIQNSDIDVGILIGNELVGAATTVRRQLGISVFVKFAQGARVPSGAISQVEDLDRFPMPFYSLSLTIASIRYNEATGALEVTFQNNVGLGTYFTSTITITDVDGIKIVGDEEPIYIEGNSLKTIVYTRTITGDPLNLQGDSISGRVFTIFGEAPKSLENTLDQTFQIEVVSIDDEADMEILGAVYDPGKKAFLVTIQNTGDVEVWVNPEMVDIWVNGELITIGIEEPQSLEPGESITIEIPIELLDEDFLENEEVTVRVYFGERRLSLIKVKTALFPLEIKRTGYVTYVIVGGIIILLLLALLSRKRCKHCGYFNSRSKKSCKRCHHRQ